ncbi:hypothetical protein CC78DRAFT_542455 [Lojkania enalia]|uniref:Uncharacterized protein n=1 Tax=Lojkania enalia TaxID=147567 RepID=A0A9P4KD63_9PLEO|nr:hypothetical protein CC78DRAFT_542455 [Didymosphaeria enalia]
MVRSLVVVGSPTLASVPEQSPGGPSSEGHGMSNNEHHHHGSGVPRLFHDTSSPAIENVEPSAPKTTSTGPAPDASMSNTVDVQGPRGARSPSTRKFITHLKHKIRDLPFLRKFRLRGNARRRMEMRAKSDGKRPVPQPSVTNEYAVGREVDESKSIEASPPESKHNKSSGSDQDKDAKDRGVAEAMKLFERDKDRLTQMNEEEREVWIRDQITYFTDFRTWRAEVSIDRNHGRRSHDVFGSGHGFDDMSVVTHHPSVISLESVRLSQATTVGSLTATSGVRHYMLDTIMHPDRPRSRSPRPLSHPGPIARLRHEYELPHDAADRRSSMDSAASIRAVRNMPVVNGHSLPSLVSTGITVSPDAPTSQLQSLPSAQEDVHIDHIEGPPPSELTHEATPYINGHQTSEEASGNISSGVDHSSTMQSSGAS